MKKDIAIKIIEKVLAQTKEFNKSENFHPIKSSQKQLEYVIESINNKNDRVRLDEIMFGIYAVREFYSYPDNYAENLFNATEVVNLMKKNKLYV